MDDQQQELDIKHYLQVIYKKRYLFILVAAGIITLITIVSFLTPAIYEASTTVSIEKNYLNVLMRDITVASSMDQQVQALSVVMTSRSMLLRVLTDLETDLGGMSELEIEKFIDHLQKNTKIKFDVGRANSRNMDIFSVTYRGRDPRFVRDYVNAIVKRYVIESLSFNRKEALGANRFIYEQMELYKEKIDRTERELAQQQRRPGVRTAARLEELQKTYNKLLTQYTEKHPEVMRIKAEIDDIEATRQQGSEQKSTSSGISANDRGSGSTKGAASKSERKITDIERDLDAYKKVYESLVASLGRSEVSAQVEVQAKADTFNIIEPAVLPIKPVSRPRWTLIILGILAGIVGGAGTVVLLDMMDKTIKKVDTLKDFGIPVIGMIPRIQSVDAIIAARKKDVLIYAGAGAFLAGIMVLVVVEFFR